MTRTTPARSTTTTTTGRKLAAGALSLPLALTMAGTAAASEPAADQARSGQAASEPARNTFVNGNANSSDDERPTALVVGTPSQPISKADESGNGANPGSKLECAEGNPYCSNGTGLPSANGVGDGEATGKPCAGCVGKADNKNPRGQAPGGSDANAGYECDTNQGIGQTNPAHTGCTVDTGVVAPEGGTDVDTDTDTDTDVDVDTGVDGGAGSGNPTGNGGGTVVQTPVVQARPITGQPAPTAGVVVGTGAVVNTGGSPALQAFAPTRGAGVTTASPSALPFTGSTTSLLLALGAGLVVVGGGLALSGRRETLAPTA